MVKALYVHVPFCENICAYCDFFRCKYHHKLADDWLIALEKEIKDKQINKDLETIYIGGGTPSALSIPQLECLLNMLKPYTNHVVEYTIEANIEHIHKEFVKLLSKYKINRISLGIQTLQDDLLKMIHRFHTKDEVEKNISLLHHYGISNISVDLMYGLPKQTLDMWKSDLNIIVKNPYVKHISLYALTIEEHSEFGRNHIKKCDDDLEADFYDYAISYLSQYGFQQYEISNFSKEGFESKHNQMYWNYADFYGLGCGASGKENHVRYDQEKNIYHYIQGNSVSNNIVLSKEDEMFEMIMMGLRLKKGINILAFNQRFQINFKEHYKEVLDKLSLKKWIVCNDTNCYVTESGMHFLHDVLILFLN